MTAQVVSPPSSIAPPTTKAAQPSVGTLIAVKMIAAIVQKPAEMATISAGELSTRRRSSAVGGRPESSQRSIALPRRRAKTVPAPSESGM